VVLRWRNRQGGSVVLQSNWITRATNLVMNLPAGSAGAMSGPNTLELVRLGPGATGGAYWVQFDYLRLESQPGPPGFARPARWMELPSFESLEPVPNVEVIAVGLLGNAEGRSIALTCVHPCPGLLNETVDLQISNDLVTWHRAPYSVLVTQDINGLRFQSVCPAVSGLSSGGLFFRVELTSGDLKLPPR